MDPGSPSSLEYEGYYLVTDVIDQGPGISEEKQKYLFKPFLELKDNKNWEGSDSNSIGIGLSCSKTIANAIKGDIFVMESEVGTIMRIYVPI